MSSERLLLLLLLLASAAAWTGAWDGWFSKGHSYDRHGVPVLSRHERSGTREELVLADGARATLSVPRSTRRPRPIVVWLEEARDSDPSCGTFESAWRENAFVLCVPIAPHVEPTAERLRSALQVTKAKFGDHVAKGSVVLGGAREAAELATVIARQEPAFFKRLILVEGQTLWSSSLFAVFKRGGGERVLFVCESAACREAERQLSTVSRSVGVDVAVEGGAGWLLRRRAWLEAGDLRFSILAR